MLQYTKTNNKNVWRLGIEISPEGRAVSYAFLKKHPGDTTFETPVRERRHIIVPAKDVIHLFMPLNTAISNQYSYIGW